MKCTSHRIVRVLAAAFPLMGLAEVASASLISIDFEGYTPQIYVGSSMTPSGLVPLDGQVGAWNALDLGARGQIDFDIILTPTAYSLLDEVGTATTVDFSFNTEGSAYDVYDGSMSGIGDNLGKDAAFMKASIGWAFAGLQENTFYNIRIFGQSDGLTPINYATFGVMGGTPITATTSQVQNYVDFTVSSDGAGGISGTFAHSGIEAYSGMSGIQIKGNFVPEPSATLLVLLGGLLGVRRCR